MIPSLDAANRLRLIGIVLLVVTFVAGGISGAALDRRASARAPAEPQLESEPVEREPPGPHQRGLRSSIFDQLDLTPTQRAAIDTILQQGRAELQQFWKETGPAYRALVDSTRTRVRAVMTPEQRARFDELRSRHRLHQRNGRDTAGITASPAEAGGHGVERHRLNRRAESKESMTQ